MWRTWSSLALDRQQDRRNLAYPPIEFSPGSLDDTTERFADYLLNGTRELLPSLKDSGAPIHEHGNGNILQSRLIPNQRLLTALLPVSSETLGRLDELLEPLFVPDTKEILLLSPGHLISQVATNLQHYLRSHAGKDHPEVKIEAWDFQEGRRSSPSVLRLLDRSDSPWVLVMDYSGLGGLDSEDRSILLGSIVDLRLPYGPRGQPLESALLSRVDGGEWTHLPSHSKLRLASKLFAPFVFPLDLAFAASGRLPSTWDAFYEQVSLCNSWNASGLIVGQTSPLESPSLIAEPDAPPTVSLESEHDAHSDLEQKLKYDIVLSARKDVQEISPLLCGLTSRGHLIRVLVVDPTLQYSFNPLKRKTRLVTGFEGCLIDFMTVNQYMRWKDIVKSAGTDPGYNGFSDVILTLKALHFVGLLVDDLKRGGAVVVEVSREDIAYCDWMAALSLQEWQSWYLPRVEISVITRDRPGSLSRLLRSLSVARYFGDELGLRINVEQDCDLETLEIARSYSWSHGTVFLHHRVIHGGLLPAVVESWYPRNNDTYGLLLEDDVELSPLFYAWVKMALLRYRYGAGVDNSSKLFGISLYQQKNVELRPEGRIPFNARTLFANAGLPFPATPYLSQVPCSWGAIYFPEHWGEFHDYLTLRFSESWIPMAETVVLPAGVRSNHWLRSWKKFFIELVYLKGYVMLYPNYDGFLSLSTNHLEYGSHVRTRSKEKREMFDQPLLPLPEVDFGSGIPRPTRLLDLPGGALPRYRDLPVLNLTAGMASEEDLVQVGRRRQLELYASDNAGNDTRQEGAA